MRAQGAYGAQLHQQLTSGSFTLQIKLADDTPSSSSWPRPPVLSLLAGADASGSGSCYASARASLTPDDRQATPPQ